MTVHCLNEKEDVIFLHALLTNLVWSHCLWSSTRATFWSFPLFCWRISEQSLQLLLQQGEPDLEQGATNGPYPTPSSHPWSRTILSKIKASVKQTVNAPLDFYDLIQQIKSTKGRIQNSLKHSLTQDKINTKPKMVVDKLLATRILYKVDTRLKKKWLGQCHRANDRSVVNTRIIDYSDLFDNLLSSRFHTILCIIQVGRRGHSRWTT